MDNLDVFLATITNEKKIYLALSKQKQPLCATMTMTCESRCQFMIIRKKNHPYKLYTLYYHHGYTLFIK